ncbi:hypothetical protein HAX54_026216 [Datura stramonium]|uniref:Uncharacterized protein n=1 Tax=Datura stramonium TaxID=4076 RepID=A0ABS8S6U9_DATST|nr:hypothetical protein [Datura stramonium]
MPFLLNCRETGPFFTPPGNSSNTLDSSSKQYPTTTPPNSLQIGDISSHGSPQGGGVGSQNGQGSPYQGSGSRGTPYRGSRGGGGRVKFYYHKSMVEEPWKVLKPVIWKPRGDTRDFLKSWLPKPVSTKRLNLEKLQQNPLSSKALQNTWLPHSMKQLAKTLYVSQEQFSEHKLSKIELRNHSSFTCPMPLKCTSFDPSVWQGVSGALESGLAKGMGILERGDIGNALALLSMSFREHGFGPCYPFHFLNPQSRCLAEERNLAEVLCSNDQDHPA